VARSAAPAPLIPPRPVAGMATNRAPAYPQIALSRGETGRVMLRVSVSADGRPLEVDVAETSGYPSLDVAAEAAVRRWQFIPATQAGSPVAAIAEVPVRFRLDN
jgi:protein TonB